MIERTYTIAEAAEWLGLDRHGIYLLLRVIPRPVRWRHREARCGHPVRELSERDLVILQRALFRHHKKPIKSRFLVRGEAAGI